MALIIKQSIVIGVVTIIKGSLINIQTDLPHAPGVKYYFYKKLNRFPVFIKAQVA